MAVAKLSALLIAGGPPEGRQRRVDFAAGVVLTSHGMWNAEAGRRVSAALIRRLVQIRRVRRVRTRSGRTWSDLPVDEAAAVLEAQDVDRGGEGAGLATSTLALDETGIGEAEERPCGGVLAYPELECDAPDVGDCK